MIGIVYLVMISTGDKKMTHHWRRQSTVTCLAYHKHDFVLYSIPYLLIIKCVGKEQRVIVSSQNFAIVLLFFPCHSLLSSWVQDKEGNGGVVYHDVHNDRPLMSESVYFIIRLPTSYSQRRDDNNSVQTHKCLQEITSLFGSK